MKKVDDLGDPVSLAARKKTKTSAEYRRKGRGKEAKKFRGPTSKAARKTTVPRDGGESLFS